MIIAPTMRTSRGGRGRPLLARGVRCAFTLIEVVVVIVILGVVAAAIAPRLAGDESRRAERVARQVRNLLSVAAHRDSLGSERLSIAFDDEAKTMALETKRRTEDGASAWRADGLTPPIDLGPVAVRSAALDGEVLPAGSFRLEFPEHEPRGLIELTLERPTTTETWSIVLLPGAVQAEMGAGLMNLARPIDLDAQGSGDSPW